MHPQNSSFACAVLDKQKTQQACLLQGMSAAPFARLNLLQLRPEGFVEYLEQELGFVLARELHVATSSAGFNRPMYLLQRGM